MTGVKVELDLSGILPKLEELARRTEDLSPAMREIAEALLVSTKDRIAAGGPAPNGTPWAPKSEATKEAYRRKGYGDRPKPLTLFGTLFQQIHQDSGPDSAEVGSSMIYAAVQQFGASRGAFGTTSRGSPIPWGNIPARPFLGVSKEDEQTIAEIMEEYLTHGR